MIRIASRALLLRIAGAPLARTHSTTHRGAPVVTAAIVVLGAALTPAGALSLAGEERVRAGVDAWRRGLAPRICFTGGRPRDAVHEHTEADAMAALAATLGIPESAIVRERRAQSTWENAQRCAELLMRAGDADAAAAGRRVWLVTQPFHTRRSLRHFRRAGFVPLAFRIEDSLQFRDPAWGLRRVMQEYVSWTKTVLLLR